MSPGEKLRRRRKRELATERYQEATAAVIAQGGNCANCAHVLRNPGTLSGMFCELDSDHSGYSRTYDTHACPNWARSNRS